MMKSTLSTQEAPSGEKIDPTISPNKVVRCALGLDGGRVVVSCETAEDGGQVLEALAETNNELVVKVRPKLERGPAEAGD